ncbi:MAG: SMC-Scp complex subunit ScpB [Pseudohongiellaceae bacterium]|nr:SMC-Scp complex subunit ScpB [Pseudohongiellaceae bacterium]
MNESDNKLKQIVEGLLLAAGKPLTLTAIAEVFEEEERPSLDELKAVMEEITADTEGRGFELKEVASGYRFQVRQGLSTWVSRLWEEKPQRYTRAMLETLALIAYRQPITRGDIEEIRGVSVSSTIIRTLLDREWIRVVGHRDVPGRPAMFATTKQFLDYFNLKNLQELPPLSEIRDLDKLNPELALDDEKSDMRVLELPSEEEESDAEHGPEYSAEDESEILREEEEAMALAKRPLDEILGVGKFAADEEDEEAEGDEDDEDVSEAPSEMETEQSDEEETQQEPKES